MGPTMELTFHDRLPHLCPAMQVSASTPLSMSGTCELPIDIIECVEDDGKLDRSSTLTRKRSACATTLMSRPCTGVDLAMPHGVFSYSHCEQRIG